MSLFLKLHFPPDIGLHISSQYVSYLQNTQTMITKQYKL
jgi:hypothetical protein